MDTTNDPLFCYSCAVYRQEIAELRQQLAKAKRQNHCSGCRECQGP